MTEMNTIGMTYLTHVELGNHNAGEGGSQLSNLKMYDGSPYISGQALRHAVRDTIRSQTNEGVECTPEDACGDVENCKLCDLLGYMNTDLDGYQKGDNTPDGSHPTTRMSPLRMTPAVGQQDNPVTNDMIVQFGVGGSVKKEEGSDADHGNSIAYREMVEDTYRGSWSIDKSQIGRREVEYMDKDEETGYKYNRKLKDEISEEERSERVDLLLDALLNYCNLAGQARHMADFMPDLAIGAVQPIYNQRIANGIHLLGENDKTIATKSLQSVLSDVVNQGGQVYIGGTHNPEVIYNWGEMKTVIDEFGSEVEWVGSVTECYNRIKDDA